MGYFAAFLCAFFQSSKDIVSKKLAFNVDGTVSAFASFLYALPYYIVLLAVLWFVGYEEFAFSSTFLVLVFARAFTDVFAEGFKMHAFEEADISIVTCFLALSPVFVLIASPIITGDEMTWVGVTSISLIVLGTLVLLYRPGSKVQKKETQWRGIFLAICSAVFMSINTCFDRLAVQVASPTLSGFAMTALAALMLAPLALRKPQAREILQQHSKPLWLRGFFEVAFMVSKLFALQFMQAPYVSGIMRSSILMSIVGGRVMFSEEEFFRRLIAGLLILSGVVLIIVVGV